MNWGQQSSALAWACIGIAIAAGAYQLGIGALNNPGPGLFPFVIGVCMTSLGVSLAATGLRQPAPLPAPASSEVSRPSPGNARAAITVVAALAFYALALERLGFLMCTAVFLAAQLAVLGRKSLVASVAWSAAITAGSYLVFAKLLKITLPAGLLGF